MSVDLLDLVQPDDGWFALVGLKGKDDVRQQIVATRQQADAVIEKYLRGGRDVFFGVAKYREGSEKRKKADVLSLKAFWLDLDCGEGKDYPDQPAALKALKSFCKYVGLPTPTLVNSGRGVHVYWPLTAPVGRQQWEAVAAELSRVCHAQGLKVDPSVFEVARVMRVPGTLNFKGDPPLPVELLHVSPPVDFDVFTQTLGVHVYPEEEYDEVEAERRRKTRSGVEYSFRRIMQRTLEGEGCNQMANAVENRATLDYTDWFYALSVAAMCKDADKAIHLVSMDHPDYDPGIVEKKAATVQAAPSCAKFKALKPGLCDGCKYFKSIRSPIELGAMPAEAPLFSDGQETEGGSIFDDEQDAGAVAPRRIKYPFPFYRGPDGGIWMRPLADASDQSPVLVYKNDLYPTRRMVEVGEGDVVVFNLHLPQDGVREFTVAASKLSQKDELRKALSAWGVHIYGQSKFDNLMKYIMLAVEDMQDREKANIMRQQFGWVDNDTKFVLGDQEITVQGNTYSPPSKTTQKLAKFIGPVGSLENWRTVWELYGKEGMEPQAFAALSAFGSPLLKFFNQTGAVINLYNPRSGTGKSTVLNMINSVYGHPTELRLKRDDTMNGRLLWVGILNNLPPTMDELTNASAQEYSDFLYALSNGKGKERMMGNTNELRENNTTWRSITVSTANASFAEKLSLIKNNPEGELMRLFEYPLELNGMLETDEAKRMFDQVLMNNYGHAGPIFLRFLVSNLPRVKEKCVWMQTKLDRELGLLPRERFWSATVAANIIGGLFAKQLGLIDWDMNRVYQWACEKVLELRNEVTTPVSGVRQILGDYMNQHIQNILVVDGLPDKRTGMTLIPKREPKGELLIRIEPDTKMMYLVSKPFKDYCIKSQINYTETRKKLKADGILIDTKSFRMSKGMSVTVEPTNCLWLKLTDDFIDVEPYMSPEEANEGIGG